MFRFKSVALSADGLVASFNTSYVSVQVNGQRIPDYSKLCFNTSYVSVQVIIFRYCLFEISSVSIHPMFRFKFPRLFVQFLVVRVSIHPMFRFKWSRSGYSGGNSKEVSIHPMFRFKLL